MKVLFLCGGIGKRMFPITEDKFLLKFLGKTLLEHQIETAKGAGLTEFIIVGNPQNMSRIREVVTNLPGIKVELALQREPLGIANALESTSQFFDGQVIVVNPNDVFEGLAYAKLLEASRAGSSISYLLGCEVTDYFPGGYLVVGEQGELKYMVEKPGRGNEPSNVVTPVVHLHTDPKGVLEYVRRVQNTRDDVYTCALDAMAEDARRIEVVPYTGFWAAIKYPWHIFAQVQRFLDRSQKHISPSAYISEKAVIEGKVVIGDNVRVLENAVIRGPAYIGPNSIIGNSSLVRDYSHIGADCVVGYSTEIKSSYLGDGCWFHMSYIGDSVIGDGCSFGAGTVLANFRFDETNISVNIEGESVDTGRDKFGAIIGNNCKTGVNVSVMPGVRIGPNSIVGSHVCLTEDLQPDRVILNESLHKTMPNRVQADRERRQKAKERMKDLGCVE